MTSGLCLTKTARVLIVTLPAFVGLVILSGCDDLYPAHLNYELRTDPLVIADFSEDPPNFDPPGQLLRSVVDHPPEKDKNKVLFPSKLTSAQQDSLDQRLVQMFGTPLEPQVAGIAPEYEKSLQLDKKTLAEGSRLYRLHCLHCHGVTGNGRGPTAPWVNPHPRDYRKGVFKFTSSSQPSGERKPLRTDLLRTLREGLEGTSMPSFGLHSEEHLNAMASYVIHLSIRGETEFAAMRNVLTGNGDNIVEEANDALETITKRWISAEGSLMRPDTSLADGNVANGFKLFSAEAAQGGAGCMSCHQDFGRKTRYLNDAWGTVVRPADLTLGVYRGGRRPIDLYWRIAAGINGANMPAAGKTPSTPSGLDSKQIWDIVSFLQVLPYPKMREKNSIEIK